MLILNFKMEAVELIVEARLLKTATMDIPFKLQHLEYRFQSLVKPCFLPIYRLAIMLIVCLMAADFTVVRFLRQRGQESQVISVEPLPMFVTKLKLRVVHSNVKIKLNHETENIRICSF